MIDTLKPGQDIRCTITKVPRAHGNVETIRRLMRLDPAVKNGLRRAQKNRSRETNAYTRGGRTWYDRPEAGKIAHVLKGESWTMPYTPVIANDLRSVETYLDIASA